MRPDIILEHEDFIAVNKPSGLLSIPDRMGKDISLKDLLIERYGQILTVHRLDKDTSGLIVFARNEGAHKALSVAFEGREVEKFYLGMVYGQPMNSEGSIEAPIAEHPGKNGRMITHVKGKASHTDYKVLESFRQFSWLQFQIHTGRTHQIRVHMQHIGHSILCDELYGNPAPILLSSLKKKFKLSKNAEEERPIMNRLALHAHQIRFSLNGETYDLIAEPPKDLRAFLQQLRKL